MIGDISLAENVYIACGHTDMRKSIDGLTALVQDHFKMMKPITWQQFRWLMEGLQVEQKKAIRPVDPGSVY